MEVKFSDGAYSEVTVSSRSNWGTGNAGTVWSLLPAAWQEKLRPLGRQVRAHCPQKHPAEALGAGLVGLAPVGPQTSAQGTFLAECWTPSLQATEHVVQR